MNFKKDKLQSLEAIRGWAAIYVALGHILHPISELNLFLSFGQEAVIIFFLLSGFVIEYSSGKTLTNGFGAYFKRRFFRIYSVLIPMFIFAIAVNQSDLLSWNFWQQLAGNLLMLQDLDFAKPGVIVPTLFASALWSLHYEWYFYMIYFPLRRYIKNPHILVGISGILNALLYCYAPNFLSRLLLYLPLWWAGAFLAKMYLKNGKLQLKDFITPIISLGTICVVLLVNAVVYYINTHVVEPGIHPYLELRHLSMGTLFIALAYIFYKKNVSIPTIRRIGCMVAPYSYSLYIAHQPILAEAHYLNWISSPYLRYGLYTIILVLFCYLTEGVIYKAIRNQMSKKNFGCAK